MPRAEPSAAEGGVVYLVGAGPGDPGLLTLRGAELLGSADVVLYDELAPRALLDLCRTDAEQRHVGKRGGHPTAKQASQEAISRELVELARAGKSVVRLKGGDPYLFGRGSEEAEVLAAHGVRFEVVPGVTSPVAAAAYAGISLTHRELASSVTFVSAVQRDGSLFDFTELASLRGTVAVLMAMRRLPEVGAALVRDGKRDASTPAAIVEWGTRVDQRVVEGRLDAIADLAAAANLGSPAVLIVGDVVELRRSLRWFDARPLFGKRVLVTRAAGQAGALAGLLRRHGAEPVALPAIEIVAPPDPERVRSAVRQLADYGLVAFTSENAVAWFFRAVDELGLDARSFGPAKVAAVGPGTAAALEQRGIRADLIPSSFIGDALAEAILADPTLGARLRAGGLRVLLPRALVAREALAERLSAQGGVVDVVPVYETRAAPLRDATEIVDRIAAGAIHAVTLTSGSSADSFADLLGSRGAELSERTLAVASIGPVTTRAAEARGLRVAVTAREHTLQGLVAALDEHFSRAASSIDDEP